MAEVGYNSKFEGLEVDSRLENVVQAAPGTSSESGKGGLIPAPPAGSQDGSKTLLSNMTWGDHVTKQYIDDAVSAAGWKKQIVSKLPTVEEAKDNVMYLVKDDVASTETKNVYNEYILVTEEGGTKVLESLGMVSTGVDSGYLDLSIFSGLSYLNFMAMPPKVVTTLANLPKYAHNIIANVASATNLSMTVSSEYVGREWQVRVNNTTGTDITQPLPTSGQFQSMSGDSVVIPKNSFIELSIWYINDKLVIRVGEQA